MGIQNLPKRSYGHHAIQPGFFKNAVLPIDILLPAKKLAKESELPREDRIELLEEQREKAAQHAAAYTERIASAYDRMVHPRTLKEGDLVLRAGLLST